MTQAVQTPVRNEGGIASRADLEARRAARGYPSDNGYIEIFFVTMNMAMGLYDVASKPHAGLLFRSAAPAV